MSYKNDEVAKAAAQLKAKFESLEDKRSVLRAPELRALFDRLKTLPAGQKRADFGREVNQLKAELEAMVKEAVQPKTKALPPIDVTAPMDVNSPRPRLLSAEQGSRHPLMMEREHIMDIFYRMGFTVVQSREIDDEYHMFGSLNFPEGHPARDEYDTFVTDEGLIAPAHSTTMQHRILKAGKKDLLKGKAIAAIIPDRTFRNEDVDARHEHTFYQHDGVYVDKGVNAGHIIATLKTFFEHYFGKSVEVKTQPFYFPFVEPGFEFAASCPFCEQKGCTVCSYSGWIELLGCGMIHPNVLEEAGIDSKVYSGFAWGGGIDRLVMIKYGIEDVRHFHSGNLKFLRQFP